MNTEYCIVIDKNSLRIKTFCLKTVRKRYYLIGIALLIKKLKVFKVIVKKNFIAITSHVMSLWPLKFGKSMIFEFSNFWVNIKFYGPFPAYISKAETAVFASKVQE